MHLAASKRPMSISAPELLPISNNRSSLQGSRPASPLHASAILSKGQPEIIASRYARLILPVRSSASLSTRPHSVFTGLLSLRKLLFSP